MKYEKYEHITPLDVVQNMQNNEKTGIYNEWAIHAKTYHPDDDNMMSAGEYMKEFFHIVRGKFI